ncbi:restriction endonuclease subunit M [Vibrio phage vB_VchM_Kuja]|uniref:site-specific DNA-methyltransferase (adenine-specific) n=1 Tax=Vibrio phage vB_VchM_Kuja TaxID=2686437 RepID=A0A6B9JC03_9CAUD|nr:DNA methyltransferase [Vibrio phage vB_VchM_Kuja]QGZ16122.1 restriction endonuclease subunit M [Vibrio phage vB_VchM_Kuja]
MQPPIKWVGGKRWITTFLRELHRCLKLEGVVEPFCGGCSVTLAIHPKRAILNDNSRDVINFWTQIKQNGLYMDIDITNTKENYEHIRDLFNQTPYGISSQSDVLKAQYFYYLIMTCYNGLCRFSKKTGFNTPFGNIKSPNIRGNLRSHQKWIENYQFIIDDFVNVINMSLVNDLLFVDPPYFKTFVSYSQTTFTYEDQVKLAKSLENVVCPTVTTNSYEPEIINLYKDAGFKVFCYMARRSVSCDASGRKPVREMIAIKNVDVFLFKELAKKHKIILMESDYV